MVCVGLLLFSVSAWAQPRIATDSVTAPRYSVRKTAPWLLSDLNNSSVDLQTPQNIKTVVEYDDIRKVYIIHTLLGDSEINAPLVLTPTEYADWSLKQQMANYFRSKNNDLIKNGTADFNFTNMKFDLGPAEKIFGKGGVQIKTQGSAELKFGVTKRTVDNPTLTNSARNSLGFNFDEKININVNGKVGDKMTMDMNYNTDATFDFDSKKLKLEYDGKEDEIIKLLEAGNVSMPSNMSLIKGVSSLFGIRADLQFGKLKLQTVVSQQQSESKTVKSNGGTQTTDYEISAANYDESRHFFLAQYFRDQFDKGMSQLPNVTTGITINKVQVWVTNTTATYDNSRNLVTLADLGEYSHISNSSWHQTGTTAAAANGANDEYASMISTYSGARSIDQTSTVLSAFDGGTDYAKVENARLLSSSEYTLNTKLGYISLKSALQSGQVLAVAFSYTLKGTTYQVGEFSSDISDTNSALFVKMLRSTDNSPSSPCWNLMMKNVYSLGASSVQSEKFELNVKFESDTTGVYITYLPKGKYANVNLLKVLNLDRLDANNTKASPDGKFDFISGYTIETDNGRVIFPCVEPFGSYLANKIGDASIASRYVFQELYDSTKTVAKQLTEKNKFIITGQYKGSSGSSSVIQLGSTNLSSGSVVVTAGGVTLTENVDYTVDYNLGTVTIINQSIIDAGTSVSVSLESNSSYNQQRKTMLGLNFQYDFSKNFQIGGTIQHLSETPLTTKVAIGSEPINNTIFGLNTTWKHDSQWLTNMVDKLPFVHAVQPSTINFSGQVAKLIAGQSSGLQDNSIYIDDFESTENDIDIRTPSNWMISSTPYSRFSEASLNNNINYGKNRALLAWYTIDPLFTNRSSSLTPSHIKSDLDQLSNNYVRTVYQSEVFPNKESSSTTSSTQTILNLAYYPRERGPYNLDENLTSDGYLKNPTNRWGGIMRKLDTSDFESANIEYMEFWVMDPFSNDTGNTNKGGDFYIDLGEVSEDVLKDGKKFYENGMPIDGDSTKWTTTVWGRVPTARSITYAFDNTTSSRKLQDVGLDGLSATDEATFPAYQKYLEDLKSIVTDQNAYAQFEKSPSGDLYHYYRGTDYDKEQLSILGRYKKYNNTEGNSMASEDSPESYDVSAKNTPDVEDVNQDYTLNENEKYYEYKVSIRPEDMVVGSNFINDKRTSTVTLRNGKITTVNWYQIKIPIKQYTKKVGAISDFSSIRFMRMYFTNFSDSIIMRMATLNLVRGDWLTYDQAIANSTNAATGTTGTLAVSTVNIEDNSDKTPVNYVLPPGITRVIDPSQTQLVQENEQSLSLNATSLGVGDAKAVYKTVSLDLRHYKRLLMFSHAEQFLDDATGLTDKDVSVFIRLGSDCKNNYYEYEIPLKLTPAGEYNNSSSTGRLAVWPEANNLNVPLTLFTSLKKERNAEKNAGNSDASYSRVYSIYDQNNEENRVSIKGNPSLGEIKALMIGIRNNSRSTKSVEVWVDELRIKGFEDTSGWAAQGSLDVKLSDLGTVNLSGETQSAGFGGIDASVSDRNIDASHQYSFTTNFELGRFLPSFLKLQAPIYYSYSREWTVPTYDVTNSDLLLSDVLATYNTQAQKDSVLSINRILSTTRNFSISNMRFNISSKKPMPYDPANFTFGFSYSKAYNTGSTIQYENQTNWRFTLGYSYSPIYKPWEPFKNIKSKSAWLKLVKYLNLNYLPQNISFNSDIYRTYYEEQLRDLDDPTTKLETTVSKSFLWNRDFALRWDLTKNLQMSFNSTTNAEIEEPDGVVNKDLYPDEYSAWKDSVRSSLLHFGRPLDYNQSFSAGYKVPFDLIPIFNWMNGDVKYASTYTWDRGVDLTDGTSVGNTIANTRALTFSTRFNLENLYNKIPYLKTVNRYYSSVSAFNNSSSPVKKQPKKFDKEIQLLRDTSVIVSHELKNKKIRVTAINVKGQRYALKYKVLDMNRILILSRDSSKIRLTITQLPKTEDKEWYKLLRFGTRFAMMVRSVNVSYRNTYAMTIPGFLPDIGDFIGQSHGGLMAPGLDFAFGMTGAGYLQRAKNNGWLLENDSVVDPATTSAQQDLQIKITLEPFRDFKIDLSASRTRNRASSIEFMYDGMPTTQSGNFNMTVLTLKTAFEKSSSSDGYQSKAFTAFLNNLDVIQKRVENLYVGTKYPSGTTFSGQNFDPAKGTVKTTSADVMVPAFLAAYSGQSSGNVSLDFFPSLLKMMPNWRFTYSGLAHLDFIKRYFKSLNLNHAYKSLYSVGSYSTFSTFHSVMGDLGYVDDVTTGDPIPSSMYDISTVSINETFAPLLGVDLTLKNGITGKLEYHRTRTLTLSTSSSQIVETSAKDWVIGGGYKIVNFKLFPDRGKTKNKVSNDLNLKLDVTIRNQFVLARDIQEKTTQATSGNKILKISFSADYALSRLLTMSFYYDRQKTTPLVSSSSYPVTNTDFGISLKISLTR